ncbi:MAG: hypothetical protein ACTSWC_02280 [Promethearchaeota archaeon]
MKEADIKILLQLKEELIKLIKKKEEYIEDFQKEIDIFKELVEKITNLISKESFISAANLIDAETAAKKEVTSDRFQFNKKIFVPNTDDLIADLNFSKNTIKIRFSHPEQININQERFITEIIKPILVPLKKTEQNLQSHVVKLETPLDTLISSIILQNVQNYESFILIYDEFKRYILKNLENAADK